MVQARPIFGYWNMRIVDRGNVNRNLLTYAQVDFEDKRYGTPGNDWAADKNNLGMDYPNLPHIIDGDFKITESAAVTMYIADRWAPALMGTNAQERSRVIQLHNVCKDALMAVLPLCMKAD